MSRCVSLIFVLAIGCGTSAPPAPPGPMTQALAAWDTGDKELAALSLVAVDWSNPNLSGAPAMFTMTEQEFMSKWKSAQNGIMTKEVLPNTAKVRDLAKHALSLGEEAKKSGDIPAAVKFFESVRGLGDFLAGAERLASAQLVGAAIMAMADERLAGLDQTDGSSTD